MGKTEETMLKLVDIRKEYTVATTQVVALKQINLEFRKSEFVSILGPSGCGKTTMLNLIGGLDKYTSGDLIINGTSTSEFKDAEWDAYRNNSIGFVFQSYNLIPHLNILGNVELALTLSGISKSERTQKAQDALTKVGLEDHMTKKPNQLSGGQMQRVAIARALINNPDIVLADEPTGALDSETSVQIMDLLKEVAKERLVIMVTHNPELANEYSTRIVSFKDGEIISDTNPLVQNENQEAKFVPKKTSMPFKMALSLSLKNLFSKKARTIITAFAGSIGIFGIACVLALSNGFQNYVDKMQMDMMSEYPLELKLMSPDMESLFGMLGDDAPEKFPNMDDIFVNDTTGFVDGMMHYNKFTPEFIEYMNKINDDYINDMNMLVNYNLNLYKDFDGSYNKITTGTITTTGPMDMVGISTTNFGQLIDNTSFVNNQYDVLAGKYPTKANELVILVDEYNMISDTLLVELGILEYDDDSITSISFDDILKTKYKWVPNNLLYSADENGKFNYQPSSVSNQVFNDEDCMELEIVGIMRMNKATSTGAISSTIGYTSELTKHIINYETSEETKSDIVKFLEANDNAVNPHTHTAITETLVSSGLAANLEYFAASTSPSIIRIYPKTFESKGYVTNYISDYNIGKDTADKIYFFDSMEMMVSGMNTVISSVSYVLIAFTSISLIVSSVMIGIITYVSVIERTKEIGVLRSIGARKKDISRVFNAETIIIGFTAGVIAITCTYLISIPINLVVSSLLDINGISNLNPIAAIILITISVLLTLLAGLVPSRIAAKKDPVTALRTE